MAVLEKIREKTVLVLVMIGLGMFGFLFMGSDQSSIFSCNGGQLNSIGSINGEEVDIDKYNEYLGNSKTQNSEEIAHKNAWGSLVNEKLIFSAASDLNLTVTNEEIKELFTGSINPNNVSLYFKNLIEDQFNRYKSQIEERKRNNPNDTSTIQYDDYFVDVNGNFSGEKVGNFLENRGQWPVEQEKGWSQLEDEISKQRLSQKHQTLIVKGIYTTKSEIETTLNERANANVKYISIPYPVEEVDVTEEEILSYYDKHISAYQNEEETRNVEYVTFPIVPSKEDTTKTEQEMIKKSLNFVINSKCKILSFQKESDIIDTNFLDLIKSQKVRVKGPYLIDGVYRIAKFSDSIIISDTVKKYTIAYLDKEIVASESTIKDCRYEGQKFIKASVSHEVIQEDSKSKNKILQYWWILLDIGIIFVLLYFIYIKKRDVKRFVPYVVLLTILVAVAGIYFDSESEDDAMILTDNSAFKSLSDSLNIRYDAADAVNNMQFNIKDLQDSREIVRWMFDANTKVGDVSNTTYRCGDDFVVVSLSAINPNGDKTLESVRDIIIQEIQNDQKFDDIASQLSGSPNLEEASSLFNTDTVASEVNFESLAINNTITDALDVQNFVGAVNALDEGETSRLIKGNNAAYLIYIVSKGSRTEYTEAEKDKIRQENSFGVYYEQALKTLKENSDIVDNRSIFY
ncbi:MAG: SurA N-terminal domain-containing protein [Flavobacteriales bacterium]|nr:SurA N-terminal domain-containing protein [Flavobacteriales bacterium]